MLIHMVEAVSCENRQCAEFAKLADVPRSVRRYYCPTCHRVSPVRGVDAQLLTSPDKYEQFLVRLLDLEGLPA
jgi:hypothetical protein